MELRKFKATINKAEELLIKDKGGTGVCYALDVASGYNMRLKNEYDNVSCPKTMFGDDDNGVDNKFAYWNGHTTPKNLPRRIDSLRLFEQIAISDNLYKDF